VLFVARMSVLRRLVRASSAAASSALRASPTAHRALKPGARLLRNTRAGGRLSLAAGLALRRRIEIFLALGKFLAVFFGVFPDVFPGVAFLSVELLLAVPFELIFAAPFALVLRVSAFVRFAVLLAKSGSAFRRQRFVVHFVGDGIGFFGRVFVIVVVVVVRVQGFLQLFEFGRLDKRFGHGFDGLGAFFGIGLGFFVFGFRQLFGERSYFFLGQRSSIRGMRIGDRGGPRFEIQTLEIVGDFLIRVR
jgi:hypothetical protein